MPVTSDNQVLNMSLTIHINESPTSPNIKRYITHNFAGIVSSYTTGVFTLNESQVDVSLFKNYNFAFVKANKLFSYKFNPTGVPVVSSIFMYKGNNLEDFIISNISNTEKVNLEYVFCNLIPE